MHLCVTVLSCSSAWVATLYSGFFRTYLTDFYGFLPPFTGLSLIKNVSVLKIVLCYNVPGMVLLTSTMCSPWFYDWANGMVEFSRLKTPGVIRTWWKMEFYPCQPKTGGMFLNIFAVLQSEGQLLSSCLNAAELSSSSAVFLINMWRQTDIMGDSHTLNFIALVVLSKIPPSRPGDAGTVMGFSLLMPLLMFTRQALQNF